jgi:hypothetical protein
MALSAPRAIFGIHSVTPYRRNDGTPYGIMKVLQSSSLAFTGELIDLNGGSQKYAWASEDGLISAEMTLAVNQFEDFMFELFLGATTTKNAAEATGAIDDFVNVKGATVRDATNGISGITVTASDEGDLKFGKYVIKALSALTFDLYLMSDVDIGRGNDAAFQNDALKLNATALDLTSGNVVVAELGLTFTKAGTPAMVAGDTATFRVRPPNSGSSEIVVGSVAGQVFPEFGAIVIAQKRGNGEMVEVDLFRCKAAGMPVPFETNAFAQTEITAKALYDTALDGVYKMVAIKPV